MQRIFVFCLPCIRSKNVYLGPFIEQSCAPAIGFRWRDSELCSCWRWYVRACEGILRYQVDFQTMEPLDDLGADFDLDDYWQVCLATDAAHRKCWTGRTSLFTWWSAKQGHEFQQLFSFFSKTSCCLPSGVDYYATERDVIASLITHGKCFHMENSWRFLVSFFYDLGVRHFRVARKEIPRYSWWALYGWCIVNIMRGICHQTGYDLVVSQYASRISC